MAWDWKDDCFDESEIAEGKFNEFQKSDRFLPFDLTPYRYIKKLAPGEIKIYDVNTHMFEPSDNMWNTNKWNLDMNLKWDPEELEKEIVHINSILNREIAKESIQIAENFDLAYTQLKIVNKLENFGMDVPTYLYYPTSIWKPRDGFKLEKELLHAFMHQESMFNIKAKSKDGAIGLMQVLPSTAKFITKSKDVKRSNSNILKNPEINLEVGQEYLTYLLDLEQVSRNLIFLAAAYNGGPGNLQKWKNETNYMEDSLFFMESIPSRETRWFIEKILTKYWIYQNKNNKEMRSLKMLANGNDPLY